MKIKLPYGKRELAIDIPDENLVDIIGPPEIDPVPDEKKAIEIAFLNPINSKRLSEIAYPGATVSIAISDASRPNVERKVMPSILNELEKAGVKNEDITIIIGTGSHRPASEGEIQEMLGDEINHSIKIINHSDEDSPSCNLGKTNKGFPVIISRYFMETDIKIAVGTALPHPIAGYSGGGKAVAVGLSNKKSITAIHTPATLDDPQTGLGKIDNNKFLDFCYEACEIAGVDFLVNCILDYKEKLVDIACGNVKAAHQLLIERTAPKVYEAYFNHPTDVTIVSVGFPKDSNLYHICAEGISIVAGNSVQYPCVKEGGTIIIVSPMNQGIYNFELFKQLSTGETAKDIATRLRNNPVEKPGIHRAYAVADILSKHEVIIANSELDPELIKKVGMLPFDHVDNALQYCINKYGKYTEVMVVNNSHRIIPKQKDKPGDLKSN